MARILSDLIVLNLRIYGQGLEFSKINLKLPGTTWLYIRCRLIVLVCPLASGVENLVLVHVYDYLSTLSFLEF